MTKIAVYAIAKNEEQFVSRWVESARDADGLFILDTGSSDETVAVAEGLGVTVASMEVSPWRFDVARNASLAMIPEDFDLCVALDMDEVLVAGWREHLEAAIEDGVNRPRYKYTWSWKNGSPDLQYGGDKIHARHGFTWKHPVHEVIVCVGEERQGWYGLEIHHFPDSGKSRGQYFPLLKLAVEEDPEDDRNAFYYARELFFHGDLQDASEEFQRHLNLPRAVWGPERAASFRYLYKIHGDPQLLLAAVNEAPDRREALVELAQHYHDKQEWWLCLQAAMKALSVKEKPLEYLVEEFAWGSLPHDLAAVAAFRLGLVHEAAHHGMEALKLNPYDDRLVGNCEFYREAVQS